MPQAMSHGADMPFQNGRFSVARLVALNQRFPVFLCLLWAILYLPRPFMLGFYHDDWWSLVEPTHSTAPFSRARLSHFFGNSTAYAPRPVYGLATFLLSSINGASARGYQFSAALLVLAAALSLRSWLRHLSSDTAADVATLLWMATPWMLGVTAWPILAPALLAQVSFTEAAKILCSRVNLSRGVLFSILLIASYMTYEAFYFQMLAVLGFYAWRQPARTREMAALGVACVTLQTAAIGFNRLVSHSGNSKRFSPDWQHLFKANFGAFMHSIQHALGAVAGVWWILIAVLAAWSLLSALLVRRHIASLLTLAVASFLLADLTYSLAGYGFSGIGLSSRTLFSASFAFVLAFAACADGWLSDRRRWLRGCGLALAGAVILMAARAQMARVAEWAHAWRDETAILAAAPVEQIAGLDERDAILFIGPSYYKGIVIFGASWDLTGAVRANALARAGKGAFQGVVSIYPATESYQWRWKNAELSQELPGSWSMKYRAERLFVWDFRQSRFYQVSDGFTWPPPHVPHHHS